MNSSFSPGDSQVERQEMKREENKKRKPSTEDLEMVQSKINNNPVGEMDEPQQSDNPGKSFKNEMEHSEKTNAKQLKDMKQKEGASGQDEDDCKNQSSNKLGMKSNVYSAKDNALTLESDLSNGNVNLKNDVNNREELNYCCQRKRKRYEVDCMEYDPKFHGSGLTCIGILPGLGGNIESSDDSDQSCSSGSEGNENVKYDLLGRSIVYENKCSTGSG